MKRVAVSLIASLIAVISPSGMIGMSSASGQDSPAPSRRIVAETPDAQRAIYRYCDQGLYHPTSPRLASLNVPSPTAEVPEQLSNRSTPPGPGTTCEQNSAPSCQACNSCGGCATCTDGGCGLGCCGEGCCEDCDLCCPDGPDPWKLFDCCCLNERQINIGGYVSFGYTANSNQPADHWNGTLGTNDRDDFQMNQLKLSVERPTNTDGCGWDLGGRIDVLYGTDARWYESLGLETRSNGKERWSGDRFYHGALEQMYAEVMYNKLKTKIGKFDTILEYEVIDPRGNFFYSHSYGFLYAVPFTQTGVLFTEPLNKSWTFAAGFTRGWDRWQDDNDRLDFLGSATWTSCDQNQSVAAAISSGDEIGLTGIDANRTAYSITYTNKMSSRLTYVLVHDYGVQQHGANRGNSTATWCGLNNYLLYQLSCDWWLGGRAEWFRDRNGTRVAPIGDSLNAPSGSGTNLATAGGFAGDFFEYTVGLNYKPVCNPNWIVRPELRWDHYDGTGHPFNGNTQDNQFTFAIDTILRF